MLKPIGHLTLVDESRPGLQRKVRIIDRADKVCGINYRIVWRGPETIARGLPNNEPGLASLLRVFQVRQRLILTRLSRRWIRDVGTFAQGVHVVALRCLQTGTLGLF